VKPNPLDDVLDRVMVRQHAVSDNIARRFKKTSPFAAISLTPEMKQWAIDHCGTEDMKELIDEYGMERVGIMLHDVNKLRRV
jgi:hypothetical protein